MLQLLVVPLCFVGAGLVGHRLGTPPRVAAGLVAVGVTHLSAFLAADQALTADAAAAAWVHLVSQWLFLAGFVALVWLASAFPFARPDPRLVLSAGALGAAGPLLAAVAGPTPSLVDPDRPMGPVVRLVPGEAADVAAAPLLALPLLAVVVFAVRRHRAGREDRRAMRWPIAGLVVIACLALAGTLLASHQDLVTALFLLGAPVFPLTVAFGPVARRLDALTAEVADVRARLAARSRPDVPPGALARLTPRELTVLEAMAQGMANPVIARTLHLSLSSVEKHATSIFRKLQVPDGPDVHRRVAAVVAYRDALDADGERARPE